MKVICWVFLPSMHTLSSFYNKIIVADQKKEKKINMILDKKLHLSVYLDIFTTDK